MFVILKVNLWSRGEGVDMQTLRHIRGKDSD